MKSKYILTVFISFLYFTSWSQTAFQRLYGSGIETGYSVLELQDGYLIMGSTGGIGIQSDVYLVKTDFDGTVQWSKKYGGTNNEEAYSITPTFDGGFVIAGSTTTFTGPPLNGPSNVYLIKVNDSGDLQWSQSISVSAHDVAFSVKETFDHGFILTGATDGFSTATSELFLVKTDSSGITEWIRSFETIGYSHGKGQNVIQTRDSGFAVVGYESGIGDTSIYLITTTSTGLILNTLKYTLITNQNLLKTYGYDIIQNNSGNLIITGAVGGFYGGLFFTYSPFLLETDSSGIYVASRYYSLNSGDCRSYSVKQTNDGGYIIGGVMGNYYPMMIKTTNSLNTEWCYYYGQFGPTGPINTGIGFRADETNDGGYIMAGMWKESGGYKMQLIKTDSLGQSSCNQGSPALGCTESTPIQSSTFLSIFPISSGTGFANATIEQIALASDSVLCLTTSLTEHNENSESIKIYPNPASNYISVVNSNHANSESEVFIFDINGKLILHSFLSPGENEINIENLRSGVYSVRTITDGYSISVNRLVKL